MDAEMESQLPLHLQNWKQFERTKEATRGYGQPRLTPGRRGGVTLQHDRIRALSTLRHQHIRLLLGVVAIYNAFGFPAFFACVFAIIVLAFWSERRRPIYTGDSALGEVLGKISGDGPPSITTLTRKQRTTEARSAPDRAQSTSGVAGAEKVEVINDR
jgi:hypothetical protein